MANTNGKAARKRGGGNRYSIKRSWHKGGKDYRNSSERRAQHESFKKSQHKP